MCALGKFLWISTVRHCIDLPRETGLRCSIIEFFSMFREAVTPTGCVVVGVTPNLLGKFGSSDWCAWKHFVKIVEKIKYNPPNFTTV